MTRFGPRLWMALCLLVPLAGCNWIPGLKNKPAPLPEPVLSPTTTAADVAHHVNKTSAKVYAWRAEGVKIHAKGPGTVPIPLNATLAVESPRNFRLVAGTITGDEADLGSNSERFWFWMRRSKPHQVYTIQHQDLPALQQVFPVPFQPDWLMETLGVIPLDATNVRLDQTAPSSPVYRLVAVQTLPSGKQVQRVIEVEKQTGFVVAQSLFDDQGALMGRAKLMDHRLIQSAGIAMPHRIELEWPQAETTLSLTFNKEIEVNPANMAESMWNLPEYDNYPTVDLGEQYRRYVQGQTQFQQQFQPGEQRAEVRPDGEIPPFENQPASNAQAPTAPPGELQQINAEQPAEAGSLPEWAGHPAGPSAALVEEAPPFENGPFE